MLAEVAPDAAENVEGVEDAHASNRYEKMINIKDRGQIFRVDVDSIEKIDAAGDYMCIYTGDNTLILRETMKDLEKRLDPRRFQRVHRSTIVNLDQVRQVKPHTNGECFLVLGSGSQVKVSAAPIATWWRGSSTKGTHGAAAFGRRRIEDADRCSPAPGRNAAAARHRAQRSRDGARGADPSSRARRRWRFAAGPAAGSRRAGRSRRRSGRDRAAQRRPSTSTPRLRIADPAAKSARSRKLGTPQ